MESAARPKLASTLGDGPGITPSLDPNADFWKARRLVLFVSRSQWFKKVPNKSAWMFFWELAADLKCPQLGAKMTSLANIVAADQFVESG